MDYCHVLYHIIIVSGCLKSSLKIDKNVDCLIIICRSKYLYSSVVSIKCIFLHYFMFLFAVGYRWLLKSIYLGYDEIDYVQ